MSKALHKLVWRDPKDASIQQVGPVSVSVLLVHASENLNRPFLTLSCLEKYLIDHGLFILSDTIYRGTTPMPVPAEMETVRVCS